MKEENESYNNIPYLNEKKIIIYLIIVTMLLVYYSLFFIHNINVRNTLKDTKSIEIKYPQNNNEINNSVDINLQGNTMVNNTTNSNVVNNNTGNGEINNPGGNIVDNNDRFKITQDSESWKDLKSLDIFNNRYFNDHSIIAPGISGKYNFTVENYRENKMQYNLNFTEQNIYNINMVYKLKSNGSYIAGDEQEFVKYNELNKEDLVINANAKDVFTIEWKWQDDKNDTQIGKTEGANYSLKIIVNAFELEN